MALHDTARGTLFIALVACVVVAGCSDDVSAEACGGSPFVGRYLWNIGNCEVGTTTAVDATACSATLCSGNARDPAECMADRLSQLDFRGTDATLTRTGFSGEIVFERSIDCARETSVAVDECARINCVLDSFADTYALRDLSDPPGAQVDGDGIYVVMDRVWPAANACQADAEIDALVAELDTVCP